MRARLRLSFPFVAMLGLAPIGCSMLPNPAAPPGEPDKFIGPFAGFDEFTLADEVNPSCQLEELAGPTLPDRDEGWKPAVMHKQAGSKLTIRKRAAVLNARSSQPSFYRALLVEHKHGELTWLRNTPVKSIDEIDSKWKCAVSWKDVEDASAKLVAGAYQLAVGAPGCQGALPIVGDVEDVTFAPYRVKKRKPILDANGQLIFAITLEADGGEKRLIVPSTDLGRCFVVANRPPPPPAETKALLEWLQHKWPAQEPPPPVSFETLQTVTGLDPSTCAKEGSGPTTHYACSSPVVRVRAVVPPDGGDPRLYFARERVADALHVYGGKLVAADDVVGVDAVVRLPKLSQNGALARSVASAIAASTDDADLRAARAVHGYRILRQSDNLATQVATHYVDVDLSYAVPEVESTSETRTHRYVAGKKSVVNPDYTQARAELKAAKADLASARADEKTVNGLADDASKSCDKATGILSVICDTGRKGSKTVASVREKLAERRVKLAEQALGKTARTIEVDDVRDFQYGARITRRRGEALAQVTIVSADGAATLAQSTLHVPFEAVDVEIPNDPDHKLVGHPAKPPTVEDAEKSLGDALVSQIDKMLARWSVEQESGGGDLSSSMPGTRRWATAVARRAASGRPVRLIDDALETREDRLFDSSDTVRVRLPEGASNRCFTFTATPVDGRGDVNLALDLPRKRRPPGTPPIAKDVRIDPDAGFEVCGLSPGSYSLKMSFGGIISAKGVLVSLFESTPGKIGDAELRAAADGKPRVTEGDAAIALNRATTAAPAAAAPVKAGDRDGDGIADDVDACPADPETVNRYLDEDGCPDEVPPGWVPPPAKKP